MTRRTAYLLSMLCFAMFLFASVKLAHSQTVTPAAPPTDWTFIVVVLIIGAVVAVAVWYFRKHPSAATTTQEALTTSLQYIEVHLKHIVDALEAKATPAPTTPPAPAAPQGKNGVAGTFTITVTGDPKVDMPAINSSYFS